MGHDGTIDPSRKGDRHGRPWWYRAAPGLDRQLAWRREVFDQLDQDWFNLSGCGATGERRDLWIDQRGERVFCVSRQTGAEEELVAPLIGGWAVLTWRTAGRGP